MKITKEFAPMTIVLETKTDLEDFLAICRAATARERQSAARFKSDALSPVYEKATLLINDLLK